MANETASHPVRLPFAFIALSFAVFLLYSHLLSKTERGLAFLDPFSLALDVFWLCVLVWIASMIYRGAPGTKGVLLFLACLVAVLSLVELIGDDASFLLFAVSMAEAALLFAAYLTTPFVPPPATQAVKRGGWWKLWQATKYLLIAWGVFCGVLVAAVASVTYWWMYIGVFSAEEFDPAAWSKPAASAEDSCHRGAMAADIEKRVVAQGMAKADVERLLGPPDGTTAAGEYRYALGACSGLRTKQDALHLYFDQQGLFQRAAIVRE